MSPLLEFAGTAVVVNCGFDFSVVFSEPVAYLLVEHCKVRGECDGLGRTRTRSRQREEVYW